MAKKKSRVKSKKKPKKSKARSKAKVKKALRAKTKAKTRAKTKAKGKPKTRAKAKTPVRKKSAARASKKVAQPVPKAVAVTSLPDIEVQTTNGGRLRLTDLRGRNVVLYFYPKDDTPGCTTEGCDIRDRYDQFQRTDTVVLGVSRDSLASHEKFKSKFGFPFELISDPDETLCRAFGVMRMKSLYGREYLGVDRSTFVFDKQGKLRKEIRGVKVDGHADELLNVLNAL